MNTCARVFGIYKYDLVSKNTFSFAIYNVEFLKEKETKHRKQRAARGII